VKPYGSSGPDAIDIAVAARIRARRSAIGMGQETLGAHLGLSGQTVRKLEAGSGLSPGRLVALARVLGVDIADFFEPREWRRGERAATEPPIRFPAAAKAGNRS